MACARDGIIVTDPIVPELAGVSETMLWALHNRASEARRRGGILADPDSVRIHEQIDYDFTGRFGTPGGALAARAAEIDTTLRRWLKHHPEGVVVSLGEGLETQARRVDNGRMRWLSVDLPPAIRLRERFLAPTERFRHIAASALDPVWMESVAPSADVFIVAQGLLMYLETAAVRHLFRAVAERFPGAEMTFDVIPRWFSHLTLLGLNQTPHYRLPPMPWGIDRDEIEPTLRRWHPRVASVAFLDYPIPRGLPRLLAGMTAGVPVARHRIPSLVHVTLAKTPPSFDPDTITPFRIPTMTMTSQDNGDTHGTMGDILAVATRNAGRGGDIAKASTQVIAKRVALGIAAALDPGRADHGEFARMVPEKVEAFSAAGMVILRQSGEANREMMRLASAEMRAAAHAALTMSGCSSPAALAEAQGRLAHAWFERVASSFITLGMRALNAQAAAMAPIRQTVVANAERLAR